MPGFLVTLLIGFTRSAVLILLLLGSFSASAAAEENRWGFGTDVGVWTGTTNDSVFALGLHLDYYMDRNFSFGGMALFTPVGDLTEIGIAGVAKYHLRFSNGVNLVPFVTGERAGTPHEQLFWRMGLARAALEGVWKMVDTGHGAPGLFNLADDVGEAHNIAAEHPERLAHLLSSWEVWNRRNAEPRWGPGEGLESGEYPHEGADPNE